MATIGELLLKIQADTDQAITALNLVEKTIQTMGQNMKDFDSSMNNLAKPTEDLNKIYEDSLTRQNQLQDELGRKKLQQIEQLKSAEQEYSQIVLQYYGMTDALQQKNFQDRLNQLKEQGLSEEKIQTLSLINQNQMAEQTYLREYNYQKKTGLLSQESLQQHIQFLQQKLSLTKQGTDEWYQTKLAITEASKSLNTMTEQLSQEGSELTKLHQKWDAMEKLGPFNGVKLLTPAQLGGSPLPGGLLKSQMEEEATRKDMEKNYVQMLQTLQKAGININDVTSNLNSFTDKYKAVQDKINEQNISGMSQINLLQQNAAETMRITAEKTNKNLDAVADSFKESLKKTGYNLDTLAESALNAAKNLASIGKTGDDLNAGTFRIGDAGVGAGQVTTAPLPASFSGPASVSNTTIEQAASSQAVNISIGQVSWANAPASVQNTSVDFANAILENYSQL